MLKNIINYVNNLASRFFYVGKDEITTHWSVSLSIIYLIIPLLLFCYYFLRMELSFLSSALIIISIVGLLKRTDWSGFFRIDKKLLITSIAVIFWLVCSGMIGPFYQNSDWWKHYGLIDLLVNEDWPVKYIIAGESKEVFLRYSLAYYLVPTYILKFVGVNWSELLVTTWSGLGLYLFFRGLLETYKEKKYIIVIPLVFITFSGADYIGLMLTGAPELIPPFIHYEWWAGWIQYSSNMTSLLWTPQHAISAWLGVMILITNRSNTISMPILCLLFTSIVFWSPFSAIGLIPLALPLLYKNSFKSLLLNWKVYSCLLFVSLPMYYYISSGGDGIPSGFIWGDEDRCIMFFENSNLCFSLSNYLRFILFEFFAISIILVLGKRKSDKDKLLYISIIALTLLPLYRFGIWNDLAMRVSVPFIAVLSIFSAHVMVEGKFRYKFSIILFLLLGSPTWISEVQRSFFGSSVTAKNSPENRSIDMIAHRGFKEQYFANRDELTLILKNKDLKYRMLSKPIYNMRDDVVLTSYGKAKFDFINRQLRTDEFSDASLITPQITLPMGWYEVVADVESHLLGRNKRKNAGHISVHGKAKIISIMPSDKVVRNIYRGSFFSDGKPLEISFGIGGWAEGKGSFKLNNLVINKVEKITDE